MPQYNDHPILGSSSWNRKGMVLQGLIFDPTISNRDQEFGVAEFNFCD